MKRWFCIFCLFCAVCVILCGCGQKHTQNPGSGGVATRVDIHGVSREGTVSRFYSQPAKIEAVLIYLRLLHPRGPVRLPSASPEQAHYEIVVHLSDGSQRIHRQFSDSYATTQQGWWGTIDPGYGQQLSKLIRHIPSDPLPEDPTNKAVAYR